MSAPVLQFPQDTHLLDKMLDLYVQQVKAILQYGTPELIKALEKEQPQMVRNVREGRL